MLEIRYCPSDDVVARVIEDEIILVPLTSGVGDLEDELYTLNEAGRAIWERCDGTKTLAEISAELAGEFEGPPEEIERDVIGFTSELARRKMLVEAAASNDR